MDETDVSDRSDHEVDLVREPRSAVALCGQIVPEEVGQPSGAVRVLTGPDKIFEYPREFLPVVEYFQRFREEVSARRQLASVGAPDDALDRMIASGQLVRVQSSQEGQQLAFSAEVRLEPLSVIWQESSPGEVWATPLRALNDEIYPIGDFLAEVIFNEDESSSLLARVRLVAEGHGMPYGLAVRSLSTELPGLLSGGYVSFRHVR